MPYDNCDGESVPWPGLSAEQTRVWLHRYQRNARVYAWGFYVALLPLVFIIIWTSMGELNADVFWSLGFFALVTFLLAFFSQRTAEAQWVGVVVDKYIKTTTPPRHTSGRNGGSGYFCIAVLTKQNKKVLIRASQAVYAYFALGDLIFKAPALNWPEKATLAGSTRMCLCCGAVLQQLEAACPRCQAPVLDHDAAFRFSANE